MSNYWHLSTLRFYGRKTEATAIMLNLHLSWCQSWWGLTQTSEENGKGLQMCSELWQPGLPTWHTDRLTIKISKAIPTACWQLLQLFAPVSPLRMCLEWIILACARHISPSSTVTSSSSLAAGPRQFSDPRKQAGIFWRWCWGVRSELTSSRLNSERWCSCLSGVRVKSVVSQPYARLAYSAITTWHSSRTY